MTTLFDIGDRVAVPMVVEGINVDSEGKVWCRVAIEESHKKDFILYTDLTVTESVLIDARGGDTCENRHVVSS